MSSLFPERLCLTAFASAWVHLCTGQIPYQTASAMKSNNLAGTLTYVQLLGDKDYDDRMGEALAEGWDITKGIVFVEPGEVLRAEDPGRSFLSIWTTWAYGHEEHYLVLWQGNKMWGKADRDDQGRYTNANTKKSWVVACELDRKGREGQDPFIAWRLPLVVESIKQMVREQYRGTHFTLEVLPEKAFRRHAGPIRQKTLLVWKGRFTEEELKLMRQAYPHPMEFVDMPVILEAMKERDDRYAILVYTVTVMRDMLVHDAATYKMLYAGRSYSAGFDLQAGDVEELVKAIGKN